jgi:hypothetical protein
MLVTILLTGGANRASVDSRHEFSIQNVFLPRRPGIGTGNRRDSKELSIPNSFLRR